MPMKIPVVVFWVLILCNGVVEYQHPEDESSITFQCWYPTTPPHGIRTQKAVIFFPCRTEDFVSCIRLKIEL
jgi:hypothetical protein